MRMRARRKRVSAVNVKRACGVALGLSLGLWAAAEAPPSHAGIVDTIQESREEGVRLHDAADYLGAMTVYRSILQEHPHDPRTVYELAFSWMNLCKDLEGLARFIEAELGSGVDQMAGLHLMLGSAYDGLHDYAKAEGAFRRGVEAAPNDPVARFNLGVNLTLQERWAEAASSFQDGLRLRPTHASAWKGLAGAEEQLGLGTRAFFAHARVASLEPTTDRGKASARRLWLLLFEHLQDNGTPDATMGKRHISITIPGDKTAEAEGDAADAEPTLESLELMAKAILAANRYVEEWEKKTDAAFFAEAMEALPQMLAELGAPDKDPFWSLTLPFFLEAKAKRHSEALAYDLRSIAGDPDAQVWIAKHAKRVQAYSQWLGR